MECELNCSMESWGWKACPRHAADVFTSVLRLFFIVRLRKFCWTYYG